MNKKRAFLFLATVGLLAWFTIVINETRIQAQSKEEPNETIDLAIGFIDPNIIDFRGCWEPNYPIEIKFYDGDTPESVSFRAGRDNEIICDGTRDKWLRIMYESISGEEPNNTVILRFEKPNEQR